MKNWIQRKKKIYLTKEGYKWPGLVTISIFFSQILSSMAASSILSISPHASATSSSTSPIYSSSAMLWRLVFAAWSFS